MITISFFERNSGFKITNDSTFTEVSIVARDYDHEKELANEIIKNLMKNDKGDELK